MKYLLKYGKQGNLITYFFGHPTLYITKTQLKNKRNAATPSYPKKGDPRIPKNYKGKSLLL